MTTRCAASCSPTRTRRPPRARPIPERNVDAWYAAFGVKEGDKLYFKPADRVHIW